MSIVTLLKEFHILKLLRIYSDPCKAATSKVVYKLDNLVNLVKNMSLHEVKAAIDIDQQTEGESRIHQWRSMALNQEETELSNGNRDATSLLGIQTWSKRDQADENELNDVSTRTRKLTEKGRAYRATLLNERREKVSGRMMRKCSIIKDLLSNRIAAEEERTQFNDLFKMLLNIHEEYSQVLDDDEGAGEDDWFMT